MCRSAFAVLRCRSLSPWPLPQTPASARRPAKPPAMPPLSHPSTAICWTESSGSWTRPHLPVSHLTASVCTSISCCMPNVSCVAIDLRLMHAISCYTHTDILIVAGPRPTGHIRGLEGARLRHRRRNRIHGNPVTSCPRQPPRVSDLRIVPGVDGVAWQRSYTRPCECIVPLPVCCLRVQYMTVHHSRHIHTYPIGFVYTHGSVGWWWTSSNGSCARPGGSTVQTSPARMGIMPSGSKLPATATPSFRSSHRAWRRWRRLVTVIHPPMRVYRAASILLPSCITRDSASPSPHPCIADWFGVHS